MYYPGKDFTVFVIPDLILNPAPGKLDSSSRRNDGVGNIPWMNEVPGTTGGSRRTAHTDKV